MTQSLGFDIAHLLAGSMLVLSFVLLYWGELRISSGTTAVIYGTIPMRSMGPVVV